MFLLFCFICSCLCTFHESPPLVKVLLKSLMSRKMGMSWSHFLFLLWDYFSTGSGAGTILGQGRQDQRAPKSALRKSVLRGTRIAFCPKIQRSLKKKPPHFPRLRVPVSKYAESNSKFSKIPIQIYKMFGNSLERPLSKI